MIHDSLEGESRPFDLTFCMNRVCSWHDKQVSIERGASYDFTTRLPEAAQNRLRSGGGETLLKAIDEACENHRVHEFTVDTPISEEIYQRIVEKEGLMVFNYHVPKEVTDPIDILLARTFWTKVNGFLNPRLTRVRG